MGLFQKQERARQIKTRQRQTAGPKAAPSGAQSAKDFAPAAPSTGGNLRRSFGSSGPSRGTATATKRGHVSLSQRAQRYSAAKGKSSDKSSGGKAPKAKRHGSVSRSSYMDMMTKKFGDRTPATAPKAAPKKAAPKKAAPKKASAKDKGKKKRGRK